MKEIIVAAAVIAAAILISGGVPWVEAQRPGPWQMQVPGSTALSAWRMNTATGEMERCDLFQGDAPTCTKMPNP